MTAPPKRRWFRFSLRTMFVLVTVAAVSLFQLMRAERLMRLAEAHDLEANAIAALVAPSYHPIPHEAVDRHRSIAAKYRQAIWRPWLESQLDSHVQSAN